MDSIIAPFKKASRISLHTCGWILAFALITFLVIWEALLTTQHQFDSDASRVKDALLQKLQINIVMLDGMAALLRAEGYLDRKQALIYARDLMAHYPHVRALYAVQRITPYNVSQLERTMHGLGVTDFTVHRPNAVDSPPTEDNAFLYPIVFTASEGSEGVLALGADVYAHPVLQLAIDNAILSGNTNGASVPLDLGDGRNVLLMFRGVTLAPAEENARSFPDLLAILVVNPDAMVPHISELSRMSITLTHSAFASNDRHGFLWHLEQDAVGWAATSLLPRLTQPLELDLGGQTILMVLERQLSWRELPTHSVAFLTMFTLVAVVIAWLMTRSRTAAAKALRTETALRASEIKQLAVIDAIPDTVLVFTRDGYRLKFLAADEDDLFASAEPAVGRRLDEILPMNIATLFLDATKRASTTGQMEIFEYAMPTPARGEQQFETRVIAGVDNEILALVRNITARKKVANVIVMLARQSVLIGSQDLFFEECVRSLAQFFATPFAYISLIVDEERRRARTFRFWANGSFVENFEYDLLGTPCKDVLNKSAKLVQRGVLEKYPNSSHIQSMRIESFFGAPLISSTGKMIGLVAVMDTKPLIVESWEQPVMEIFATRVAMELERKRTLDELKSLADLMSYQATHDALTDLVNRREFERRLDALLETTRDSQRHHAVLYLDLDQFKIVNDTCGHIAGDALLKSLAAHLRTLVRDSDSIARLGGDEFGVLLEDCDLKAARMLAMKLLNAIREFRFMWQGRVFEIGVSIGVAPILGISGGRGEILSAADAACYVAKELGRNRVHIYLDDDVNLARRRRELHWVSEIRQAMGDNRLLLYRQSIVPVGRAVAQPGDDLHFEVLLRLADARDGITEPGMIINAAERYNLMVTVDRWVIDRIFSHMRDVISASAPGEQQRTTYAINLSGTTLNDDQFSTYVEQLLQRYELPPQMICFEITETAAITNLGNAGRLIRQLKDIGCRFALDDFGVGFSSYGYLKNLPIDFVKIDGHFVKDILDDPLDLAIVESINHIGSVIGIRTIAEWVENEAILEKLRQIGVDYAQGYALSMPEPIPAVVQRVA